MRYFELLELDCLPQSNSWQNLSRLSWMCSARYLRQRTKRLRAEFRALPPDEVRLGRNGCTVALTGSGLETSFYGAVELAGF